MNSKLKTPIKINIEPIGKRIILYKAQNGLSAIQNAGIGIKSVCGGKGTCGKCRILILDNNAGKANEREKSILSEDEIEHGIRLACQQIFNKDLNIYIPASSLTEEQKLQVTGAEISIEADPIIRKYHIKLNPPSLSDMASDYSRVKDELLQQFNVKIDDIDFDVLKQMPKILRDNAWEATVSVRFSKNMLSEIILVEGKDTTKRSYGIAVDLGTTKIAVLLVDLNTGENIDKEGEMNPQISFGEDVMSRINFAMQSEENLKRIQKVVIEQINKIIETLTQRNSIKTSEILELTLVGNTAMHHLFLGFDVRQLGLSPFVSVTSNSIDIKAKKLGINICLGGYIYLLPVVAGFVGSDHIAMIVASGIYNQNGNILGIDIGTNTEIVLKTNKGLESVSTASGPAFEGAHIKYGMRAAPGAIERVIIDKKTCLPKIQTINDKKPIGICGSGILDAVAELLKAKIINRRGKFDNQTSLNCLCKDDKGNLQYILDPSFYIGNDAGCKDDKLKENTLEFKDIKSNLKEHLIDNLQDNLQANLKNNAQGNLQNNSQNNFQDKISSIKENEELFCPCKEGKVAITQKDIVEIQLAKSAIRTGINILLESAGIDFTKIDKIIIAGAFGSYIDPKNVIDIGMFPQIDLKKVLQVGNAAAIGAKMVLVSKKLRCLAEEVADKVKYIELTVFPTFSDNFVKSTLFPDFSEID